MTMQQQLPQKSRFTIMALEGRFYPVGVDKRNADGSVLLDILPQFRWEWDDIPYAIGNCPTMGVVSFRTKRQAWEYVQRHDEHFGVLWKCEKMAAQCELYPERNAWYIEEIRRLVGNKPRVSLLGGDVMAYVVLASDNLSCYAPTIDDAYEALYQKVYEHVQMQQQTV